MTFWHSAKHGAVVYVHEQATAIASQIPGARALNAGMLAVPCELFALQVARLFGLPAPPFLDLMKYDWPCPPGRKPYDHQRYMASFAALHPRHYNFSQMGTGKTSSSLWAADYLMRCGAVHRCLILSPLSTLRPTWEDEIFRMFLGRRSAIILHGERAKRIERLEWDADFYVINHDGIKVGTQAARPRQPMQLGPVARRLVERADIDLVIVDEASAFKEWSTTRSKVLAAILEKKPYVWMLSGTPTPNAPTDAYALAKLQKKLPGVSFTAFRDSVMKRLTEYKWIARRDAVDTVHRVLSPAVRFSRDECLDLPECTVETRVAELSPDQRRAYDVLKRDMRVQLQQGTVSAVSEGVLRLKLLQIVCGAVYGQNREVHVLDTSPRLAVLRETIEEAGGKILVFAPFTSVVDMLYQGLSKALGADTVARIYGGTTEALRRTTFQRFQDPDDTLRVIVADPGTMSHGLTLTEANTIVWWGPTDKPEIYDQANARINRPGQTRRMLVVRIASTPVEKEIYRRLQEKASLQGVILKMTEEDR